MYRSCLETDSRKMWQTGPRYTLHSTGVHGSSSKIYVESFKTNSRPFNSVGDCAGTKGDTVRGNFYRQQKIRHRHLAPGLGKGFNLYCTLCLAYVGELSYNVVWRTAAEFVTVAILLVTAGDSVGIKHERWSTQYPCFRTRDEFVKINIWRDKLFVHKLRLLCVFLLLMCCPSVCVSWRKQT